MPANFSRPPISTAAQALSSDDSCRRRAWYERHWRAPSLSPKQILREAIEHGLQSSADDPGEAAAEEAMRLAVEVGIDTAELDLLGLTEHIAAQADFLTWLLRVTASPWERPETLELPSGSPWVSGAFLGDSGANLRSIALVDRWDAWTQTALEYSWAVAGECSVYGAGMTVTVFELGSLRKGRWTNPFTSAYRHPVGKVLRFRRRDGEDFSAGWEKVWREKDSATREQWLDQMTEDGVLPDVVHVHAVAESSGILHQLAQDKLVRIAETREAPEIQPSRCFDKLHPCPYRSACPFDREPSEELGFVRLG